MPEHEHCDCCGPWSCHLCNGNAITFKGGPRVEAILKENARNDNKAPAEPDILSPEQARIADLEAQLAAEKSRADRLASLVASNVETWADRAIKAEAQLAQAQHEIVGLTQGRDNMKECWGIEYAARESAEAQVGALTDALTKVRNTEWNLAGPANIDHAGRWYINPEVHEWMMATVETALANLPAAAERLLAAQRQAESAGNALWEAEAQCAALAELADEVIQMADQFKIGNHEDCNWGPIARDARELLASLPAAAEKLLAAQRVAEALHQTERLFEDDEAHPEWRDAWAKACDEEKAALADWRAKKAQ